MWSECDKEDRMRPLLSTRVRETKEMKTNFRGSRHLARVSWSRGRAERSAASEVEATRNHCHGTVERGQVDADECHHREDGDHAQRL